MASTKLTFEGIHDATIAEQGSTVVYRMDLLPCRCLVFLPNISQNYNVLRLPDDCELNMISEVVMKLLVPVASWFIIDLDKVR